MFVFACVGFFLRKNEWYLWTWKRYSMSLSYANKCMNVVDAYIICRKSECVCVWVLLPKKSLLKNAYVLRCYVSVNNCVCSLFFCGNFFFYLLFSSIDDKKRGQMFMRQRIGVYFVWMRRMRWWWWREIDWCFYKSEN